MIETEVDKPFPELTVELIKKKAVKGVALLTGRTFIMQAITLAATFLLTVFLTPAQYGTFFLVSAITSFFTYFSDIGLAAALIQKKEPPTDEELKTSFTMQQGLVFLLVIIIVAASPLIKDWYKLSDDSLYLLWALAFSLILSSLKTIPSILMERQLDFNKLVIPQIVETILYNIVAVVLAWRGFGVNSFTTAVLVRGVAGLVIIYLISPWKPGFAFSRKALKTLLHFGLPYQANTFLAVIKDDGMTAFLGGILGTSGIGFLGWAQKWAAAPLRFFMDQVIKVTFPAFSRMQQDKAVLSRSISRSIFFICLLVFPALAGLTVLASPLTELIPKYHKWQPALLALYLISLNTAWAAVSTPITNVLNAIGKITVTFKLMIMWVVLTWALVPLLSYLYGVTGAATGFAVIGFSSIVTFFIAGKYITIDYWDSVVKPLLAAAFMGLLMFILINYLPRSFVSVGAVAVLGLIVYSLIIFALAGETLISDLKKIRFSLIAK